MVSGIRRRVVCGSFTDISGEPSNSVFRPEEGGCRLLRNIDSVIPNHKASRLRRLQSYRQACRISSRPACCKCGNFVQFLKYHTANYSFLNRMLEYRSLAFVPWTGIPPQSLSGSNMETGPREWISRIFCYTSPRNCPYLKITLNMPFLLV